MFLLNESGPLHDTLNPKLWDKNNKLQPDFKKYLEKFINAYKYFIYSEEKNIEIVDIRIIGSNASFNYDEEKSDIDVHFVIDFSKNDLLEVYLFKLNSEFKKKYEPTFKGISVESYPEDLNSSNVISNGIFSVKFNKWIKFPKKIDDSKNVDVSDFTDELVNMIDEKLENSDKEELVKMLNYIYLMRKNSLAVNGEYGKGNLIFKDLRNRGYLDKIRNKINEFKDDELSLQECLKVNNENKFKAYL